MTISEKIRYFRKKNKLTQEMLAEKLNISFQAVSKWERNESLPDVTLIGKLAELLGVTCDALLTDNACFIESEIDAVIEETSALNVTDHEEYLKRADILEKALEKHPRSIRLMLELADTYAKGASYPEYSAKNYFQRTVEIEEYVAGHADDPKQKYHAVTMLCYMYRSIGKYDRIRELAEMMPELYQTRPALIHHSMPGDGQYEGISACCISLLDMAECYLNLLVYPDMSEDEKAMFEHLRNIADSRERWNTSQNA